MKVRTPKFRVRSADFDESFQVGNLSTPSFSFRMDAELGVKNANFGNYKFQNSSIFFLYGDTGVGEAAFSKSKAGWRSTKKNFSKKFHVSVDLSSKSLPSNSQLGNDLRSGVLNLRSQSRLDGKVELLFIFKKKKSVNMDCTLTIGVAEKQVRQISCK
ncbi:unnamed protein product [Coffea canephora]|uniref:DH200=94 genomic scaffold, scaffold_1426 n=1 Tax=Coffea canephora TaxID=49390 RepID=A0A068VLQ5_COFCA|nr:unnamed protein product [Coffea canephora]